LTQSTSACPWVCGSPLVDTRDGRSYNTTMIGSQCWFAQNINVGSMLSSTSGSSNQTDNGVIEKYCYNNDVNNCNVYGGMYQWAEMVQYFNGATNSSSWSPVPSGNVQGICPSSWHV